MATRGRTSPLPKRPGHRDVEWRNRAAFDASASFLVGTQPSAITVGISNGDGKRWTSLRANFKKIP